MPTYKVSRKARYDLLEIGRFTQKKWGATKRNSYLKQLDDCFKQISENPELGLAVDFIAENYRKFPQGSHIIFYRLSDSNVVEIIRVLHKNMDVEFKF